jgi:hypothetical protein
MISELDRLDPPGIRGASVADVRGPLGALELAQFEPPQRAEEDPDHWRKVLMHSLTIRRDVYLEVGGFPARYSDFAPWGLAMALEDRGARLAYSPRPRVSHVYDGDLAHVGPYVRGFMRGETLFRRERREQAERYLDWPTEWAEPGEYTRRGAMRALRAAVALRHWAAAPEILEQLAVAVLGVRGAIALTAVRARMKSIALQLTRDPNRRRGRFLDYWRLESLRGRLEAVGAAGPARPLVAMRLIDLTDSRVPVVGAYAAERLDGERPIRWTSPLSVLKLSVPGSGPTRARIELRPIERPAEAQAEPRIAVDCRPVAAKVTDEAIEFELDAGDRWLAIACEPWVPGRSGLDDSRRLGLPLRSISFDAPPVDQSSPGSSSIASPPPRRRTQARVTRANTTSSPN